MAVEEMGAQVSPPPTRIERVAFDAFVVAAAAAVTNVICMFMFSGFAPPWMILVVAAVPAGLAFAWALSRRRRSEAIAVGAIALVACLAVAAWSWVPEPALARAVEAHKAADTAVASRLMADLAPGVCRPASAVDLGPLSDAGHWSQVCRSGLATSHRLDALDFESSSTDQPDLRYAPSGPYAPGGCSYSFAPGWWIQQSSRSTDPNDICPRGFLYHGGG
jgi:hypothetical protein